MKSINKNAWLPWIGLCCLAITSTDAPVLKAAVPVTTRCHAVGMYMPAGSHQDDRVHVTIQATGHPMVIVLCSYSGTEWNVTLSPGAKVEKLIVSGWFESTVKFKNQDKPGFPISYLFGAKDRDNTKSFWAYGWHTVEGRKMRAMVKELTELDISTFQGTYEGKNFVIDGKLGKIENNELVSDPKQNETQFEFVDVPVVNGDRKTVESYVRRLFEMELQDKQKRIDQIEADLKKIKEKYAKRKADAEKIIASRVDALLETAAATAEESKKLMAEVATDPVIEAWRLWNEAKFQEALPLFEASVKKSPDNGAAWNGLGWSLIHLGQPTKATEAFKKAIELEPSNFGAKNGLGRAMMALGKMDEAEKVLLEATNDSIKAFGEEQIVKGQMTAAWIGLIDLYIRQNDLKSAKEWIDRYTKHSPDDPNMKIFLKLLDEKAKQKN